MAGGLSYEDERPFVLCNNLVKIYKIADQDIVALQGLNLSITKGEVLALIGPSGVGKSTLLNIIGGLDTPDAGSVQVAGWDLLRMKEHDRVIYKRQVVGFVWQQPARNLLPYLTARENIELPMEYNGMDPDSRKKRSLELLDVVELAARANFLPDRLSGGEQQRTAIAVALANNPLLLLADEPSGQVDTEAAMHVLDALQSINQAFGTTIMIVTHSALVASRMERVITIRDGHTSTEIRRHRDPGDDSLLEEEWSILDPTGRLQLPRSYVNTTEMKDLVRLHLEPGYISIWPRPAFRQESPKREATQSLETALPADGQQQSEGLSVKVENLTRTYQLTGEDVHALRGITLTVRAGSFSVIKGPSGSGKTTLLNLIACLDEPTSGKIQYGDRSLQEMTSPEKTDFIREKVGYVFQTFGLLPFLSVEENVQIPLRLMHTAPQERQRLIAEVLKWVGLEGRTTHRVYELSGGEQQRVAIARALVKKPALILADEPTGQLDSLTGASIITLLKEIACQTGVTVLVASHDPNVHEVADWLFELSDGRLVKTSDKNRDLIDHP
jgi:peptide/nickel transport system ATP-binding protein